MNIDPVNMFSLNLNSYNVIGDFGFSCRKRFFTALDGLWLGSLLMYQFCKEVNEMSQS